MEKRLEQLHLSESGRDEQEENKFQDSLQQQPKHTKKLLENVGAENVDELEGPSSSNSIIKGGIFTMTIPLQLEKTENSTFFGSHGDFDISRPQNEFCYGAARLETKTTQSIQLSISKLSSLRQKMTTPYHFIANLPWRLAAKTESTKRTGNVKFFSVYIDCNPESESTLWSCDAVVEFRLISQKSSGAADFTRQLTNKFSYNSNNWGFPSFMEWSEITNPDRGFVREDKVLVEAQITVQKVVGVRPNPIFNFTENNNVTSDGILVIDGVRLYISKPYLALYSPVFHAMFYSKFVERDMKEIPIEDVILEEFIEMLNVVYPSHAPVTADTVEYLLELGDKFEIQFIIDECEKFLIDTDEISIMTKLVWADQYCLAKLQDVCMRTFKNANEIKALKNMDEFRNLSDTTKAALLEKIIKLV